jgi:hypothetical protein
LAHVELLWELATGACGAGRTTELQRATFALRIAAPTQYVTEKTNHAETMLEIWLSPGKWRRWGMELARANAVQAVGKLRSAVESDWIDDATRRP